MTAHLKIALVIETSGGGAGRHMLDLAEGLAARGQDVTVIWSPVRAQSDFRDRLLAMPGVAAHELTMQRAVGPGDLASLRALATLLRRLGPFDVLHGHSSKAGALVRLLPRRIPGRRIYTPHAFRTMDPTLRPRAVRIYQMIERLLAPRADCIIAVSAAEYDHALSLGIGAARLTKVINGAALPAGSTRAAARQAMALRADEIAVGFIGRLDPQKDPLRFVEAVSQAARDAPALRGVVIGDGALRDDAQARAPDGLVRFLGWQDGPALFPGLDVFCMTSFYEAMPYTLLEALHAGVPVVSTAVGGTTEAVIDGQTGFVLPVNSPAPALAERLVTLARSDGMRARFGRSAQALAQSRSLDTMLRDTLAVYRNAPAAARPLAGQGAA